MNILLACKLKKILWICVCDDMIMSSFQLDCEMGKKSQVFESKWREVLCSTTWDVMKWAEEITIRKYDISLFSRSFQTTATVLLSAVFCLSGFAFVQVGSLPVIGSQKLKNFVVPCEEKQVKSGTCPLAPPSCKGKRTEMSRDCKYLYVRKQWDLFTWIGKKFQYWWTRRQVSKGFIDSFSVDANPCLQF